MKNVQNKFQQAVEEKSHIIMEDTMVMIPWYTNNAELYSTVLEQYQVKNVRQSPLTIVEKSCEYFGSDLPGRIKSASTILKGQRMLPILISEINKVCMVPLCSPFKPECIWLNYKHVLDIIPRRKQSIVILSNYQKLELDITRDALESKLNKAARLLSTYDIRQEQVTDLYRMHVIAEEASLYSLTKDTFDDQFN